MYTKKGQAANETAMMVMVVLGIVVIFMAVLSENLSDVTISNYENSLRELASVIESEAQIALYSENGYFHSFTLPPVLSTGAYTIEFINATVLDKNSSVLRVHAEQGDATFFAEKTFQRDVMGNIVRGKNTARKENGIVVFRPLPLSSVQLIECGVCSGNGVTNEECCDHATLCCAP
jgi:type II secretory pathway pseudopilin PulG